MLTDHSNKKYCGSLGEVASEVIAWHTEDNRETRHAENTYDHNLMQIKGICIKHIENIIDLLENTVSLERAGFALTKTDIANMHEDELIAEDGFAQFHAFFMLGDGYPAWKKKS